MEKQVIKKVVVDLLRRGHTVKIKASGLSMVPMLWPRMVLHAKPCAFEEMKVGDIGLFDNASDHLVAHRVMKKRGDAVLFQGDSCILPDGWIDGRDVVGRVVYAEIMGMKLSTTWIGARVYGRILTSLVSITHWPNHIVAVVLTKILILKGKMLN